MQQASVLSPVISKLVADVINKCKGLMHEILYAYDSLLISEAEWTDKQSTNVLAHCLSKYKSIKKIIYKKTENIAH